MAGPKTDALADPDDDVVASAIDAAPYDDLPESDEERAAVAEARAEPEGFISREEAEANEEDDPVAAAFDNAPFMEATPAMLQAVAEITDAGPLVPHDEVMLRLLRGLPAGKYVLQRADDVLSPDEEQGLTAALESVHQGDGIEHEAARKLLLERARR